LPVVQEFADVTVGEVASNFRPLIEALWKLPKSRKMVQPSSPGGQESPTTLTDHVIAVE
jgi:hypothetical protein